MWRTIRPQQLIDKGRACRHTSSRVLYRCSMTTTRCHGREDVGAGPAPGMTGGIDRSCSTGCGITRLAAGQIVKPAQDHRERPSRHLGSGLTT